MIRSIGRVLAAGPSGLCVTVPGWPGHRPGQFAMLTLDPRGSRQDPLLPRPMAIYRGEGEELEFRYKIVGRGTQLLAELPQGAPLGVMGPLGNGFAAPKGRAILVGGGTGIASLYELATNCTNEVRVLLGGRSRDEVLGLEDFEGLSLELGVTTEDGSFGTRGQVTDLLELEAGDEVYACGPKGMMRSAYERAHTAGARCWVSLETYMACGFGICLGCAAKSVSGFRYVCTDGPVFDAEEIVWDELP